MTPAALANVSVCPAALRIHISAEMKQALDAVGGFRTEHRGLVDVKVGIVWINLRHKFSRLVLLRRL